MKIKEKKIYSVTKKNLHKPAVAVFLSGLSGSKDLPLFKNASTEFVKNNYGVIRIEFFSHKKGSHKNSILSSEDMSLQVYVQKLRELFDNLLNYRQKIILVGHSFGAVISILFLHKYKKFRQRAELILWDPTHLPWKRKYMEKDFHFDRNKNVYVGVNTDEVMNKKFYEECINIKDTSEILGLSGQKTCIISAERGAGNGAKRYFKKAKDHKNSAFFIIKNANHYFDRKNVQKVLFDKTFGYLKRTAGL